MFFEQTNTKSKNKGAEIMNDATLFRRAFLITTIIGVISRMLILRLVNKQQPTQPQDYIEQLILSIIASALGAVAYPALLDKEFSALTFLAIGIQQFQDVAQEEKTTLTNIDTVELSPRGPTYIEDISRNYEVRNYLSLFTSLFASVAFILCHRKFNWNMLMCTGAACVAGAIVGFIFKKILTLKSIGDVSDVEMVDIEFDGPLLKVDGVMIANIGLETSRQRYIEKGVGIKIIPNDMRGAGIITDLGQKSAILHDLYIHMGVDRDVDEPEFISIAKTNLNDNSVVFAFIPLVKDINLIKQSIKSTPIIQNAKGNYNAYSKDAKVIKNR